MEEPGHMATSAIASRLNLAPATSKLNALKHGLTGRARLIISPKSLGEGLSIIINNLTPYQGQLRPMRISKSLRGKKDSQTAEYSHANLGFLHIM